MFFNTLVAYYYIMKNIFFSLLFILFLSAFDGISQTKLLSIQDAVSKGRTSLAPKRLQNLSFIPGSSQLSYLDRNHLFVLNTKNGKEINHLSKNELNAALIKANMDSVSVLEGILFKNENELYFLSKKGEMIYSFISKSVVPSLRKISDASLENLDEYKRSLCLCK